MFATTTCNISKKFKPDFIEVSKMFPMYYFVYINMNEFENISYKYTQNIKETPMILMFKENDAFAHYKGSCKNTFINFIKELEELEEKNQFKEHNQKVYMLGKLDCIKELGIELTKEYSMNNTLTDMRKEFNDIKENYLKMDNISNKSLSNLSAMNNQENELPKSKSTNNETISDNQIIAQTVTDPVEVQNEINQKKLAKIKEAEAILKLKQNIEMQQMVKLQQLKKIHKFKKEADSKNNK